MYQVLYRKYRPKVFADVYGQEHVTSTLLNEIKEGRISHAYLFTGSRGTGKTTCAKILAKAVNCEHNQNGEPCNECEVCRGLDAGTIYDVVEIDAASNNGVDNIRDLREEANYTPARGKYRVYIIDEVHMLSTGAFNALLKTLEEPPAHVIFILATTEVHKLPATILSRCQRFDFKRIQPETMSVRLKEVAQAENMNLSNEAALLISRIADGGMRDALSILDQCAGRSRDIDEALVSDVAGIAGREALYELSQAISDKSSGKALDIISTLHQNSYDMERLCVEMINHFRNFLNWIKPIFAIPQRTYLIRLKQFYFSIFPVRSRFPHHFSCTEPPDAFCQNFSAGFSDIFRRNLSQYGKFRTQSFKQRLVLSLNFFACRGKSHAGGDHLR